MDLRNFRERIRQSLTGERDAKAGGELSVDFDNLKELIRIFEASGLSEIEIEEGGRRMRLQKQAAAPPVALPLSNPAPQIVHAPMHADAATPGAGQPVPVEDPDVKTIESPMVGTFYAAPAPGEEPFVDVGDEVDENQTVCIVEAMKLMNEVVAKFAGIVEKVLVENGQPVEFGQPLYQVRVLNKA